MPKNRKELEDMLVNAFAIGMSCGYAVEHTELADDERVYRNRYRALIKGEIDSMSDIVNGEMTFTERMSEGIAGRENRE